MRIEAKGVAVFEIIIMLAWIMGIILGIMWLFLPWIIISKIDEIIAELKTLNSKSTDEVRHENDTRR